jgi:hypothetical protein
MKSLGLAAQQSARRLSMYFVATVLAILSGLFYAASHREIGSLGVAMCQYGSRFATIRCSCWWLRGWLLLGSIRQRALTPASGLPIL